MVFSSLTFMTGSTYYIHDGPIMNVIEGNTILLYSDQKYLRKFFKLQLYIDLYI